MESKTVRHVASKIGITRSTIQDIHQNRRRLGYTRLIPRSSSPPRYSERTLSLVKRYIEMNWWLSAKKQSIALAESGQRLQ